ncbi:MAG: hypothetical protein ACK2UC_02760 [Anaerolineae bacterium]
MIARKKLDIPEVVSGRRVTNRGVHLHPFGFHGDWLRDAPYWVDLLVNMDMSWVVIITDGDSVRQTYGTKKTPLEVLLEAGVIPIIREQRQFPHPFADQDTFLWTVDLYQDYGLRPLWIVRNEPFDIREWVRHKVPANALEIVMRVWGEAAEFIAGNGGYAGFPDGPCYDFNPFDKIEEYGCRWIFDEAKGFYAGHHYGKNRSRDYPYDAVTRQGTPLSEEAYRRLLDDFAGDPRWREEPLALINRRRAELKAPRLTPVADDICWRGWEKVVHWSRQSFGYVVPMAMTEGGWVPRDRPGSGQGTDVRMPHTTPKMVAKKTLQMYDAPSPFFAICPWLLADQDMGGTGWPFDAWHGWAYSEKYGIQKPVISVLKSVRAKEVEPRSEPLILDVDGDTRDWTWIRQRYGADYRRGEHGPRLIEVHEYAGSPILEVQVVDGDGLPIQGVPFYYHHPSAPRIDEDPAAGRQQGEWYTCAERKCTDLDGRVSFEVPAEAQAPGAGEGAVWPAGRGDVLEGLGLLKGTDNWHLNGLWQLAEEEPVPAPKPEPEPGPEPEPEPEPRPEAEPDRWSMELDYEPGPEIIAGALPRPGIRVVVADPWGNATSVVSGSKTEHGPSGFEVLAPHAIPYTLTFLGETYQVPMRQGTAAYVTFSEAVPEATAARAQLEETPGAGLAAVPESGAPERTEMEADFPEQGDARWQQVFEKLERIGQLMERLRDKD